MFSYLRSKVLQRRRLRWFLIEARFHLYTSWERLLEAICLCILRRRSSRIEATEAMEEETRKRLAVAQPILTLGELSARTLLSSPGVEYLKGSVPLKINELLQRPQLLVCHDYKGGYQEDKFVQGKDGMEGYLLWHWHLIDVFVYFSHSLVTIPPPGWINAGHRHGVQVLGTFITEWAEGASVCRSLLASAETCCMYASRLAELAHELGFDGWLINIENKIDMKDIPRLHLFVQHLRQCMHSLSPNSSVIWYDAVTEHGKLDWQNCLNEENRFFFGDSDGLFTNYAWKEEMAKLSADAAGDRATDVYMGVDVFGRNTFGGGEYNCDVALKVARKAQVSAALFAPGWVLETNQPPSFEVASNRWWKRIADCWPIARANPTQLPFFTDFNRGCGARVAVQGHEVASQPWYNLSCQSLQPILKVLSHPESSLKVDMSYEAAYSGGSCLRISGGDDTLGSVQLYESSISVKDHQLHVSYSVQEKSGNLHTCLALEISKENSTITVLLVAEEEEDMNPKPSPNTIINRSVATTTKSNNNNNNNWTLREHILSLGTYTITQIHALAYTGTLNPETLLSLTDTEHSTDTDTDTNEAFLGHIRISKEQGHDRELPELVFEACDEPEWSSTQESSVSVSLRWGLIAGALQTGGCRWEKYHLYVAKDDEEEKEFIGVAVVQAFAVEEMMVSKECKLFRFYVQAICACGLPGELLPACSLDVSNPKFCSEHSSDPSQALIDYHV